MNKDGIRTFSATKKRETTKLKTQHNEDKNTATGINID